MPSFTDKALREHDNAVEERLVSNPLFLAKAIQAVNDKGSLRIIMYGPDGVERVADAFQLVYMGGSGFLQLHVGRHNFLPNANNWDAILIEYTENRDPYTVLGTGGRLSVAGGEVFSYRTWALDEEEARDRFVQHFRHNNTEDGKPWIAAVLDGHPDIKNVTVYTDKD